MLAIILLVWIFAAASMNNDETAELIAHQTLLVEKADVFCADEIYSRAIPLYEEACTIATDSTYDISYKLADAYYKSGDIKSYYELLIFRCESTGYTAYEEEFVSLAEYYFNSSNYAGAMAILDKGIAAYDSDQLKKMKEEHTYDFHDASGFYSEMTITSADYIPVCLGDKWGYINNYGGQLGEFIYDTATPYFYAFAYDGETMLSSTVYCAMVNYAGINQIVDSDGNRYALCKENITDILGMQKSGYGLVKNGNGKYVFVNSEFKVISNEFEFVGQTSSDGMSVFTAGGKAGAIDSSFQTVINAEYDAFAQNAYGESFNAGRGFGLKSGKYTLLDYTGSVIGTDSYDDAHGFYPNATLAAVCKNGKWGFIDTEGNVVIDYQFENAKSFSNGLAAVCRNGKWGFINSDGKLAIDYIFDDAFAFNKYGTAQVYTSEGYKLISLNWFNNEV